MLNINLLHYFYETRIEDCTQIEIIPLVLSIYDSVTSTQETFI